MLNIRADPAGAVDVAAVSCELGHDEHLAGASHSISLGGEGRYRVSSLKLGG
jgi:hypothetical protein